MHFVRQVVGAASLAVAASLAFGQTPAFAVTSFSSGSSEKVQAAVPAQGFYYHNSENWASLVQNSAIFPGTQIANPAQDLVCSVGFVAQDTAGTKYLITAGHCGQLGEQIVATYGGSAGVIGTVVTSVTGQVGTADYAIIKITNDSAAAQVKGSIPSSLTKTIKFYDDGFSWAPQATQTQWAAALPLAQLATQYRGYCHLGFRTGLSCGEITATDAANWQLEISAFGDHGDSGGPIFAVDSAGFHPVGITSWVSAYALSLGGTSITDVLQKHGLSLVVS